MSATEIAEIKCARWQQALDAAFKEARKYLADAASAPKGVEGKAAIARTRRTTVAAPYRWIATTLQRVIPPPGAAISRRGHCHQRNDPIGSPPFPRKIRRSVVEENVLTLKQAVHSMTGLPAAVFRVRDRGAIRPGAVADLVVFELAGVCDRATYT